MKNSSLRGLALLSAPSPLLWSVRGVKRGPPKFLGRTKTQYLDMLMRSNANICAAISLSFFPIAGYYTYRYFTVLKPAREAKLAEQNEDLLSEGQASA